VRHSAAAPLNEAHVVVTDGEIVLVRTLTGHESVRRSAERPDRRASHGTPRGATRAPHYAGVPCCCTRRLGRHKSNTAANGSSFTATRRSSVICLASYTTPMPPRPISRNNSKENTRCATPVVVTTTRGTAAPSTCNAIMDPALGQSACLPRARPPSLRHRPLDPPQISPAFCPMQRCRP
jgi:hypothetical protein